MIEVKSEQYKGYQVEVFYDEYPESPREWSNLGTMLYRHSKYKLGDEQISDWLFDHLEDNFNAREVGRLSALEHYLWEVLDAEVILPLYFYDHTVQSISTRSFRGRAQHAGWDSGVVGVIYATRQDILDEFGRQRMSDKLRDRVQDILEGEVEVFDQYIRGDVYGFTVTDPKGNVLESVGGYYGEVDEVVSEARSVVDSISMPSSSTKVPLSQ